MVDNYVLPERVYMAETALGRTLELFHATATNAHVGNFIHVVRVITIWSPFA